MSTNSFYNHHSEMESSNDSFTLIHDNLLDSRSNASPMGEAIFTPCLIRVVGWGVTESTWYAGRYWANCTVPLMIDKYGTFGGMRIGRGN
jgi:hypothetical protein